MIDIISNSTSSGSLTQASALSVKEPVTTSQASGRYFVSPYTLIDSSTNKAVLVLRDTSTGEIQAQVPAQISIQPAAFSESSQQSVQQDVGGAQQAPSVIELSSAVSVQQSAPVSTGAVVAQNASSALSAGAALSQSVSQPSVSVEA